MAQPFIGQLLLVGFNFQPVGWAYCAGQLIAISQNNALFALIGTTYGGDGQQTFQLPDLRGRVTIHQGQGSGLSNYVIGQVAGVEQVTLNSNQMPQHSHLAGCSSSTQNSSDAAGNMLADAGDSRYGAAANAAMAPGMVSSAGGSQPHENMQPYLALNWLIALEGIFPSQN
jgi:microcystin-dependent protein